VPFQTKKIIQWIFGKLLLFKNIIIKPPFESSYNDLTPVILDKTNVYCSAIKDAMLNDSVTNIALTGGYGTGKSSILKTFKAFNRRFKTLNISLAVFNGNKIDDKEVEASILQQLFYQIKATKLRDSRYSRLKHYGIPTLLLKSFLLITWLFAVCLYVDIEPKQVIEIKEIVFRSEYYPWQLWGSRLYILVGVFYLLVRAYRILITLSVSKLNLKDGGVELCKNLNDSVLNKNWDEILYFFESNHHHLVIFEDIDRIKDSVKLLTKLRELNILINNAKQIKKPVKFLYALRDDIFTDKEDRTKFFDIIIPVVPVLSANTSADVLLQEIEKHGLDKSISKEMLTEVSHYVSDMRLLKNIINEYKLFKAKHESDVLKDGHSLPQAYYNKLFAIILYKNYHPEDFIKLQSNSGELYNILVSRNEMVSKHKSTFETKIDSLDVKLEKIEKENLVNVKELRKLYICHYLLKFPEPNPIMIDNAKVGIKDLISNESKFNSFSKSISIHYWNNNSRMIRDTRISFGNLEKEVDSGYTYNEREEIILGKTEKAKEAITQEKNECEKAIAAIEQKSFAELFQIWDELAKESNILDGTPIVKYLIANGYIDESYKTYISCFQKGRIDETDNYFIQSVLSAKTLDFSATINNPKETIRQIREERFSTHYIFNYALVDQLVKKDFAALHIGKLKAVFDRLSFCDSTSMHFLKGYLVRNDLPFADFIYYASEYWPSFWKCVTSLDITETSKHKILSQLLIHCDENQIRTFNVLEVLNPVLSKNSAFLFNLPDSVTDDKIIKLILMLRLKFKKLSLSNSRNKAFDFIIKEKAYELNTPNIHAVISYLAPHKQAGVDYKNLQDGVLFPVREYIDTKLDIYAEKILLPSNDVANEDEHSALLLLNSPIKDEFKTSLIQKLACQISDIKSVTDTEVWASLFAENRVRPSWSNILQYYFVAESLDNVLTDCFNDVKFCNSISDGELIDYDSNNGLASQLSQEIYNCSSISYEAFRILVPKLGCDIVNVHEAESISSEKLGVLIDETAINIEKFIELLTFIRDEHESMFMHFFLQYSSNFIENIEEIEFQQHEVEAILAHSDVDINIKLDIITAFEKTIVDEEIDNSEPFANLLLHTFEQIMINRSDIHEFSFEFWEFIYKYSTNFRLKIKLFSSVIEKWKSDIPKIKTLSVLIFEELSAIQHSGGHTKISNRIGLEELLKTLESFGYISTWSLIDDECRINFKKIHS